MNLELINTLNAKDYRSNLERHKKSYHSQCVFNINLPIETLEFQFHDSGVLSGEFICNENHQGYDGMVHGGIIAALVDTSMTQCCMGNDIVAFTTDLTIKYKNPVFINKHTQIESTIKRMRVGILYFLECKIKQEGKLCVMATGKFFNIKMKRD